MKSQQTKKFKYIHLSYFTRYLNNQTVEIIIRRNKKNFIFIIFFSVHWHKRIDKKKRRAKSILLMFPEQKVYTKQKQNKTKN